jgi:hypothetical protein
MQFRARSAALFLVALATSSLSPACSLFFAPISVGSTFKVKVLGYDGPVKGLGLKLTDNNHRVRSAVTDGNGIARFDNVPQGTQYLGVDPDNGFEEQLEVKANGPANVIVPMGWPSKEPIHVRSLSGTIGGLNALSRRLEPVLSLELLDGISGRVLSSLNTTPRGEFDFGPLVQGLYFIHLKPFAVFSGPVEGLISVAADAAAPARADKLDLHLIWTSCGLMYTDQIQCPQPDLYLKKLEGHEEARRSRERRLHATRGAARGDCSAGRSTEPGGARKY